MEDDGSTSPSSSEDSDVSEIPPPSSPSLKLRLCIPKPYYYKPWDENEPYEVPKHPETPPVPTQSILSSLVSVTTLHPEGSTLTTERWCYPHYPEPPKDPETPPGSRQGSPEPSSSPFY